MTAPSAIVVREEPAAEAPTRRVVYHKLDSGAYERKEQLWRQSIAGWHTTGTEVIATLRIDVPDEVAP